MVFSHPLNQCYVWTISYVKSDYYFQFYFIQFPDDHDVLKFSAYSLRSPEMALVPDNVNDADSKKFEAEFEEYQKKLKKQKDDWVKENPDSVCA